MYEVVSNFWDWGRGKHRQDRIAASFRCNQKPNHQRFGPKHSPTYVSRGVVIVRQPVASRDTDTIIECFSHNSRTKEQRIETAMTALSKSKRHIAHIATTAVVMPQAILESPISSADQS